MSDIIIAESGSIDTREEVEDKPLSSKLWQIEITASQERYKGWRDRADKTVKRFRDERDRISKSSFKTNILWANTEILKSALFTGNVVPDVRRRFRDKDPVSRHAALIIERGVSYFTDVFGADKEVEALVEDGVLPGRGVLRVVYEPELDDEGNIVNQEVRMLHVGWKDFLTSAGNRWRDVWWVGFRHTLTRDEFKEAFPDIDDKGVPFNVNPFESEMHSDDDDTFKLAEVWEIWDKTEKERVWVVLGYDRVLKVDSDPYTLVDFFPMAEPFVPVDTTNSLVPIPLFTLYQDQAEELDRLTTRITSLVESLKYRGVYDGSSDEDGVLSNLVEQPDNTFLGYKGFTQLQEKGGLANVFQAVDITPISQVLQNLYIQRQQTIETIFEITGISDLVRGFSSKTATATEKELQAQFVNLRFERVQRMVNRTVRDTMRIMAEILSEHFEPQTLLDIAGVDLPARAQQQQAQKIAQLAQQAGQPAPPVPPVAVEDVVELIQSDRARQFNIDVESDDTRAADELRDREQRMAFLQVINSLIQNVIPIAQVNPTILPFVREMVLFTTRGFKIGRQLEQSLEDAFDQMSQVQQQPDTSAEDKLALDREKAQGDMFVRTAQLELQKQKADADREVEIAKVISGG